MSASLVGSEMCIRDSFLPGPHGPSSPPKLSGAMGPAASSASGIAPSSEAVSYTHLTLPTICSV
eukprot:3743596-Alexandrium_andersonii.AAC.1